VKDEDKVRVYGDSFHLKDGEWCVGRYENTRIHGDVPLQLVEFDGDRYKMVLESDDHRVESPS